MDRQTGDVEQELWRRFTESATRRAFCESWLFLQCHMLGHVQSALLLLGPPDHGPFTPAAIWPAADFNVTHLAPAAEQALKERRGLLIREDQPDRPGGGPGGEVYHVAYPIDVLGKLHGAVVLEVQNLSVQGIQAVMRQVHWGAAWLEVMLRRAEAAQAEEARGRLQTLLDGVATAVEHERFQQASTAFVTKLSTTLGCDRVSIGFAERKQVRVQALSHSAGFAKQMNLVRAIGSAMDEAIDQCTVIIYPLPPEAAPVATLAHAELANRHGSGSICTVPLSNEGKPFGALTLERTAEKPFDENTVELVKTFAALLGPIFNIKRKEERSIIAKVWEAFLSRVNKFAGPDHPGLKLAVAAAVVVVVFFTFAKGDHRVRATTVLEGVVQRAVSAPFNGYVAEAPARPGDVVHEGDILCRLDDREPKLERLKWATQREQLLRQFSEAMAKHERAQAMIDQAKADQAEAEVKLLDEQLSRAQIVAPFDGVVTSGDLSQTLGMPVERGQVLFEVAPLRGYRVIVQVDERDIGYVAEGQKGELVLPSVPGKVFPLTVTKVTPVSTAKEGRNFFRVEARLDRSSGRLRPGMEGVGKITTERRRLIGIWTHDIVEWIELKLWSWWP